MLRCITSVDLRDLTAAMPPQVDRNYNGSVVPGLLKNDRPLLVTLSAKAIGSMGFGLSILAIWLRWIVPRKAEEPQNIPQLPPRKRLRRRHRLSAPPPRVQSTSTRPQPVANSVPSSEETKRPRRVYFEDEEPPTLPSPKEELTPILEASFEESKETVTTTSTESNPVAPVVHLLLKRDTYEDSIAESDSSSRRSSFCQMSKIKSPFTSKARRRSASPDSLTRLQDAELGFEKPKRASTFTAPWSNGRKGKPTVTLTDETSSVKSFAPLSPFRRTSGSRNNSIDSVTSSSSTPCTKPKPSRHASTPAPIRRTQPYEAPYFATPPIAFQPRNDTDARVGNSSMKETRGRPTTAQTLPLNRARAIAKQRSSSLDITVRM